MPEPLDSGPPNKFSNFLDTSTTIGGPTAILTALTDAWAAYFTTYGVYPSVWTTIGSVVYYGGY
jgi:hypothetical protein